MSYFFFNRILLLLFDILRSAPPRLSIKLTTVATIPNILQWNSKKQIASIAAYGTNNGAIHEDQRLSHLSRFNDSPLGLTAFLFGHKRFVWAAPHSRLHSSRCKPTIPNLFTISYHLGTHPVWSTRTTSFRTNNLIES